MNLEVLLQALTAADAGSREVNPFAPLQDASQGIGNILLQNAQNFSPTENAWGGLAAGLLSGVTGNLANNYQDKQNQTAQDLIFKIAAGQDVGERPSNISPSVFSKLGNTTNILKLQEGLDAQKEKRQAELDVDTTIEKQRRLLEMQRGQYGSGPLADVANLPQGMQSEAVKQLGAEQKTAENIALISKYFDDAKEMNRLAAFNPFSTANTKLNAIKVNMTGITQKQLGRELNNEFRDQFQALAPAKGDLDAQIDEKKQKYIDLMLGITDATPLIGGGNTAPPGKITTPIPEGAVDTGRTAGGKKVYNVGGKLWVPD